MTCGARVVFSNKHYTKDLFCIVRAPGSKIAEFVVTLKNVSGAIAEVSGAMASLNVNLRSGFHTAPPGEATAVWSFFADLSESGVSAEELAERLKGLKVVLDVDFSERDFNGIFIDALHFPLTVMGERSVVFRVETVAKIFGGLREEFGSGAEFMIYRMGISAGENRAGSVTKKYGVNGVAALQVILAERVTKGWGVPRLLKLDKETLEAIIDVKDLFECLPHKGRRKEPHSRFFKGYLEGVFSKLFNREFEAKELECIAKGDGKCLFEIKTKTPTSGTSL